MTIDFTPDTSTIHFYGVLPTFSVYGMKLKGRYSNDYYSFVTLSPSAKTAIIELTAVQTSTTYYALSWNISSYEILDVAGYYTLELYGGPTLETATDLISSNLVKVIKDDAITDTILTSNDNENNEQVIYYR